MKIGIDVRLWNETGVGRYIRNLVANLAELDTKNEYVLFARKKDREAIKKVIGKKAWRIVGVDTRWHTVTEQFLFLAVINKENLDLMHYPYFSLPILYRKPFVVTIHDLIIHHFPTGKASTLPEPIYKVKRLGYEQVLSHAVRRGKKIMVPLEAVKKDLVKAFHVPEGKIAITNEGFDVNLLNKSNGKEVSVPFKKYFLYVGNAYPHKNLELLIKAFTEYREQNPKASIGLVFVGKDDYFYKGLRERIKKEKREHIAFCHDVSDAALGDLYRHAICLISPSLMEGFGLTALEAISVGCIPLLSDIPAFHEICGEGAVYFNPTSVKSLREKLETISALSIAEKQQYLKKGKKNAEKFSWRKMAEETLTIYESSLSV